MGVQEWVQRKVTAQMVAGRLPKDGVLVEFICIWNERYLAFVLTPDGQVTLVDLGESAKIDTKIKTALAAINPLDFDRAMEKYTRQAEAELADLYRLLLQPLETTLRTRTRLIVSPDGELKNIPFAALRTLDGRYLVEHLTVSYVASGRDLLRGKTDTPPTVDLLLVANPAFDNREALQVAVVSSENAVRAADFSARKFSPLPGTAEEARLISPLIKGTQRVLEGKEATESAVYAVKSPKVLHLATHGFFLKDIFQNFYKDYDFLANPPSYDLRTSSSQLSQTMLAVAALSIPWSKLDGALGIGADRRLCLDDSSRRRWTAHRVGSERHGSAWY
jgi:CHAT domain-containing protein